MNQLPLGCLGKSRRACWKRSFHLTNWMSLTSRKSRVAISSVSRMLSQLASMRDAILVSDGKLDDRKSALRSAILDD